MVQFYETKKYWKQKIVIKFKTKTKILKFKVFDFFFFETLCLHNIMEYKTKKRLLTVC